MIQSSKGYETDNARNINDSGTTSSKRIADFFDNGSSVHLPESNKDNSFFPLNKNHSMLLQRRIASNQITGEGGELLAYYTFLNAFISLLLDANQKSRIPSQIIAT